MIAMWLSCGCQVIVESSILFGRRPGHTVTGDTKVFQEGMLGRTPQGYVLSMCTALSIDGNDVFNSRGNLSTYKELCSLASDLNQPDLIYKFMHLANHHSLWNSKKVGVATGHVT